MTKPRLVLDTSIIVAGLRSRAGASNALLQRIAKGEVLLLLSPPLFLEYEEVLKRPDQQIAHGLIEDQREAFLAELAALAIPVDIHFLWRLLVSDASDEMVLETAIHGRASALITFNISDFVAAKTFGIRVLRL